MGLTLRTPSFVWDYLEHKKNNNKKFLASEATTSERTTTQKKNPLFLLPSKLRSEVIFFIYPRSFYID